MTVTGSGLLQTFDLQLLKLVRSTVPTNKTHKINRGDRAIVKYVKNKIRETSLTRLANASWDWLQDLTCSEVKLIPGNVKVPNSELSSHLFVQLLHLKPSTHFFI